MTKPLRIFLRITVFVAVFIPGVRPSWWIMEKLWTKDFSSKQDTGRHTFAVLVRRANDNNRYAVDYYPDIKSQSKLVSEFDDQDLSAINRDLRASISAESSHYVYFKVLRREKGYIDVSLETPTTGDFWGKNSYRIQNGEVHLLSGMLFGPIFGMTVAFLPALAGVLAILGCNRLLRKITCESSSTLNSATRVFLLALAVAVYVS